MSYERKIDNDNFGLVGNHSISRGGSPDRSLGRRGWILARELDLYHNRKDQRA